MKLNKQQAQQIIKFRSNSETELENKKKSFFDWINIQYCDYGEPTQLEPPNQKYKTINVNYNPKLKSFEMWKVGDLIIKNFEGNSNTRTKVNSETCLEIDKLPKNKAIAVLCEVLLSLIRNNYHFFVWYAEGQRSPHVRIYDFEEMQDLNPQQRVKAQILFWRKHIPFGCLQYADTGIFVDDHPLQMEYATHWKYGTPFDLLFEYKPEVETCKN